MCVCACEKGGQMRVCVSVSFVRLYIYTNETGMSVDDNIYLSIYLSIYIYIYIYIYIVGG